MAARKQPLEDRRQLYALYDHEAATNGLAEEIAALSEALGTQEKALDRLETEITELREAIQELIKAIREPKQDLADIWDRR